MNAIAALVEASKQGCACRPVGSQSPFVYGIKGDLVVGIDFGTGNTTAALPNRTRDLLKPWELVYFDKPKDCLTSVFAAEIAQMTPPEDKWSLSRLVDAVCQAQPKVRELRLSDLL